MIFSKRSLVPFFLCSLALGFILAAIYWPGLHGDFIFDDFTNIVSNAALRLTDCSWSSLLMAAASGTSSPLGRPLAMASFALNLFFFGESPFSFKLTNLAVHFLNVLLIFVLIRQLLRYATGEVRPLQPWALAAGVALLWALHPMNVTPVLFVVQRMTSMGAFFTLVALILYLDGRHAKTNRGYFAVAASIFIAWPAAVYSKETGLLLPIYIFLCEWLLLGSLRSVSAKTKWVISFLVGGVCAALCWANWRFITAGYAVRDFDVFERLLTESRVLWFYVRQLLLPVPHLFGLFHDDIPVSRGLLTPPETLLAIISWITVITVALWQRARRPLFAFAVFWFLASHLIESTILPLEIAYEHRNYLASVGIFLWLGTLLWPGPSRSEMKIPRVVLGLSFILFCGLVTSSRSLQWSDELQRTQMEVANHPDSARANYQAATEMMRRTFGGGSGNPMAYQLVQLQYKRASELDPSSKAPLIGLLYLDCSAGLPGNAAVQSLLLARFAEARFTLGDRAAIQSLSALLIEERLCLDDRQAIALIDAGLSNHSADGAIRGMIYAVAMDFAMAKMHSPLLALNYAQAAVASNPGSVALRVNLIHLYIQSNRVKEAREEYDAIATRPIAARDQKAVVALKSVLEAIKNHENAR